MDKCLDWVYRACRFMVSEALWLSISLGLLRLSASLLRLRLSRFVVSPSSFLALLRLRRFCKCLTGSSKTMRLTDMILGWHAKQLHPCWHGTVGVNAFIYTFQHQHYTFRASRELPAQCPGHLHGVPRALPGCLRFLVGFTKTRVSQHPK